MLGTDSAFLWKCFAITVWHMCTCWPTWIVCVRHLACTQFLVYLSTGLTWPHTLVALRNTLSKGYRSSVIRGIVTRGHRSMEEVGIGLQATTLPLTTAETGTMKCKHWSICAIDLYVCTAMLIHMLCTGCMGEVSSSTTPLPTLHNMYMLVYECRACALWCCVCDCVRVLFVSELVSCHHFLLAF